MLEKSSPSTVYGTRLPSGGNSLLRGRSEDVFRPIPRFSGSLGVVVQQPASGTPKQLPNQRAGSILRGHTRHDHLPAEEFNIARYHRISNFVKGRQASKPGRFRPEMGLRQLHPRGTPGLGRGYRVGDRHPRFPSVQKLGAYGLTPECETRRRRASSGKSNNPGSHRDKFFALDKRNQTL